MRPFLALAVASILLFPSTRIVAGTSGALVQTTNLLSGKAIGAAAQPLPNVTVQIRDLATGQLTATTTTGATGSFSFAAVPVGGVVVEVLNGSGDIIGTSAPIQVTAGAAIAVVTVSTSAAVVGILAATAAGGAALAGSGAAAAVIASAAGAGFAGITAVRGRASPSR